MRYLFGSHALDLNRREISAGGAAISLPPKVFGLLVHLIEQRDRAVSKEELFEKLWPGVHVSDASLTSCVKAARVAIGDDGRRQRLIRTVHGHGYRFVGQVMVESLSETAATEQKADSAPGRDQPSASTKERKLVSVLDAALHNAAALAQKLDAETLDDLIEQLLEAATAVVERHGGTLSQRLSGGLLALFGAPRAYDDPCRRAVAAALDLQAAAADLRARDHVELALKIGVHTGEVIVGPLDPVSGQIPAPIGATTELAGTLRDLAPPNTVLVSSAIHDVLAREADAEPYPAIGAGTVYLIRGLIGDRAGVLSETGAHGPFVGRHLEMSLLTERLGRMQAQAGHAVAISGESGVGKSRLLDEFATQAAATGIETIRVNCAPHNVASPFFPLKRLLRRVADVADDAPSDLVLHKLQHAWPGGADAWSTRRPVLAELLGETKQTEDLGHLGPAERRAGIFAALHELVAQSAVRPRLVVFEDVHWIDPSSGAWLVELVEQIAGHRVLLIVSHRPNYQPPWLDKPAVSKIMLEGLTPDDSRRLIRTLLADRADLPPEIGDHLIERSGGNPFFLEQLVQALGPDADTEVIPSTVQAALAARIDQ
ncbi:MAG: AAA family ATPase, partial [Pseudomonadota bacterium]